jgi:NAD+ synthase (glutamine-hydrolysing)
MDYANKTGGMVVGTGDLSEIALGWSTYNGDHMSMYSVNCSVPKTLIPAIIKYAAGTGDAELSRILLDVIDTPVSPELLPADKDDKIAQKTEDLVGPYELHDFFLYCFVRYRMEPEKIACLAGKAFEGKYSDAVIRKWLEKFLRRFFQQQFKRSCMPDGPQTGIISLSPRGGWQMPSDACVSEWLKFFDDEVKR